VDEIRVLLINLHGILGDVIKRTFASCADMIVNTADTPDIRTAPDAEVVVCQFDDLAAEEIANHLFRRCRRVKVVAVGEDGQQAVLWELRPRRDVLGDLSPGMLVAAVRRTGSP
jgi:hypothetical protein